MSMERKEALETILEAAQNWFDELVNYIIPSAEQTESDDAEGYRNSAGSIASAITCLRIKIESDKELVEAAARIRENQETYLQREEAEIYLSTQSESALLVVPGEEGLYSGKAITIHKTREILTAETGSWEYSQLPE